MAEIILEIENLCKNYGAIKALSNLSVKVRNGTVFGILGPNGSGKTTTLGILVGVLNASSGIFSWFGNGQEDENRRRIGTLLETPNFYPYLNAVQNLQISAKIKRVENASQEIEKVLKAVNLFERRFSDFRTFSLGMKQRLAIAAALLGEPDVLVLDEPTNGLDPQGIVEIRSLILEIAKSGKTIIVASHQLDEIEKICSRVLILKNGVTLKEAAINELTEKSRQIAIAADDLVQLEKVILGIKDAHIAKTSQNELLIDVPEAYSTAAVNKYCFENGIVLNSLKEVNKSLEEQFLEIIN